MSKKTITIFAFTVQKLHFRLIHTVTRWRLFIPHRHLETGQDWLLPSPHNVVIHIFILTASYIYKICNKCSQIVYSFPQ